MMIRLGIAGLVAAVASSALVAGGSVPSSRETRQEDVEAAIRAVHTEMRRAAQRLDAQALYANVVDGDTPPIIESGQLAETWAVARHRTDQGFRGLTRVDYSYAREHITVLSPTIALWIGEGTATAALADGRQFDAPFAESIVFVLRDGQWMVLHAHRSAPNRP